MGFFSGLGSVFSSIVGGISSAISSLGSSISSFVSGVGAIVAGAIEALAPVAQAIGKVANTLLQGLGIIKPDEKTEDIGDRALQAADKGITIEKFDKFEDYMNALRDFPLDPEVSAKRSSAEKLVAGIAVGTTGIEQKYHVAPGSLASMWLLPISNPDYFTAERLQTLLTYGRLGGDIFSYLEKKLSDGEARAFEKSLEVGLDGKRLDEGGLEKHYAELDKARAQWAEISQTMKAQDHSPGT